MGSKWGVWWNSGEIGGARSGWGKKKADVGIYVGQEGLVSSQGALDIRLAEI